MAHALLSDNPANVSALSDWLGGVCELSARQRAVLARTLLARKDPRIKQTALDQVVKSFKGVEDVDAVRDELVSSGLLVKSGRRNGVAVYTVNLEGTGVETHAAAASAAQAEISVNVKVEAKGGAVSGAKAGSRAEDRGDGVPRRTRSRRGKGDAAGNGERPSRPKQDASKMKDGTGEGPLRAKVRGVRATASLVGARVAGARARVLETVRKRGAKGAVAEKDARPDSSAARPDCDDLDLVRAWISQRKEAAPVPYVSRRQRAYEIFSDEKALEGKRGEKLMKRMAGAGVSPNALRIDAAASRPLQGFFCIGSDQPFIVVENIDAYEEIVALLKRKRHVKLFGARIGGVIFGAGHNICIAHALDEYLHAIGYHFDFVYYVGDIDREGARLVEKAREANVIEVRLHANMYRAMLAAHRAHMKQNGKREDAASNQDFPRDLVGVLKGLPMTVQVSFRRALRDNIRIPQEILTSEDYRRASKSAVERLAM